MERKAVEAGIDLYRRQRKHKRQRLKALMERKRAEQAQRMRKHWEKLGRPQPN